MYNNTIATHDTPHMASHQSAVSSSGRAGGWVESYIYTVDHDETSKAKQQANGDNELTSQLVSRGWAGG